MLQRLKVVRGEATGRPVGPKQSSARGREGVSSPSHVQMEVACGTQGPARGRPHGAARVALGQGTSQEPEQLISNQDKAETSSGQPAYKA